MNDFQTYVNIAYIGFGLTFIGLFTWAKISMSNAMRTLKKLQGKK